MNPDVQDHSPASRDELMDSVNELVAQNHAFAVEGHGTRRALAAPEGPIQTRLSLTALDRIERMDAEDMTCRVQCGLRLSDLATALDEKDLALESGPFLDPGSRSLGGLFSEAPHSPRGFDRGSLRSQVLGLSGLDGRGREFHAGGRVVKNVAGYDLMKLFVAGGGAWFVGLELELRLIHRPALTRVFSSAPLPVVEALSLWRSLRPLWIEARSLDLHLLGDGSATVELKVAGHSQRVQAFSAPAPLSHDESAPELWDRLSPSAGTSIPTHRGQIRPSESAVWIQSLPASSRGSLHLQGQYSLVLDPTGDERSNAEPPGSAATSMGGDALALARRLKCKLAPHLAPGRLSFDTAMPREENS